MESAAANRIRRRALVPLALAGAIVAVVAVWRLESPGPAQGSSQQTAAAAQGNLVVSVGGVGRVVEAQAPVQVTLAAAPASGGAAPVPAGTVVPGTSGRVSKVLVAAGQHVTAGQALALIDDGGSAAAAVDLAQNDFATTQLELRQVLGPADKSAALVDVKRAAADLETLLGGTPQMRAEAKRIARLNIQTTRQRLKKTLGPPSPADLSAARADVRKAESDLAVLRKPRAAPLPEEIAAATKAVDTARLKLAKLTGPPDPVEVSAGQLEVKKAQAELGALLRADPPVSQQEIDAARAAIDHARLKLAKLLGPPDPADVNAAEADVSKAESELAVLRRPQTPPLREEIAAARSAVDAAHLKLAKLTGPPDHADVTAARLERARAKAELHLLAAGPSATALAAARQTIDSSRAKLGQLPLGISLAQLKAQAAAIRLVLARDAERLLTVHAPSAGTVTSVQTTQGAPVDASTPIATVADLQHLAVSVDLSEFDVAQVKAGQPAVVSVDALGGKRLPGKVAFEALAGVDNGGVVTFPVLVSLSHIAGIKPGMNVSVRIITAKRQHVIQVPLEAVSRNNKGRPIVNVIDASGQASPRVVSLGLANNKDVEITHGLRAGERVELQTAAGA
jgi:RND family efflux transporter MFP subunit